MGTSLERRREKGQNGATEALGRYFCFDIFQWRQDKRAQSYFVVRSKKSVKCINNDLDEVKGKQQNRVDAPRIGWQK